MDERDGQDAWVLAFVVEGRMHHGWQSRPTDAFVVEGNIYMDEQDGQDCLSAGLCSGGGGGTTNGH